MPDRSPVPKDVRLDGRTVVVTGAANGIGRATAIAAVGFGAAVAVCDRDEEGLASLVDRLVAAGVLEDPSSMVVGCLDVRDVGSVGRFAAEVAERHGAVHGLVNNAGGTYRAAFVDSTSKGDAALVDENFGSVVAATRAFLPSMPAGASIVNVTSSEAFQAAPGFAVYAAMKAAVENLTKTLALELGQKGIRVNSVAPDGIPTRGDAGLAAAVRSGSAYRPPPQPPIGRFAAPEECASVIVFLLGDLAGFVTGSCVHVDGGLHAAGGWHRTPPGT